MWLGCLATLLGAQALNNSLQHAFQSHALSSLHTFLNIGIKRPSSSSTASRVDLHHSTTSCEPQQKEGMLLNLCHKAPRGTVTPKVVVVMYKVTAANHLVFQCRSVCSTDCVGKVEVVNAPCTVTKLAQAEVCQCFICCLVTHSQQEHGGNVM